MSFIESAGKLLIPVTDRGNSPYLPPAITRQSDGAVEVFGRVAVPGIYEYPEFPPGMQRVLVTAEVLRDSHYSLRGVAVTNEHPSVDGVQVPVTPENYKQFAIGEVRDSVFVDEQGDLYANLMIRDGEAIRLIFTGENGESPIRGLSASYTMALDLTPGYHPLYGAYDAICSARSNYNHVALTNSPRAGDAARLILQPGDSKGAPMNFITLLTLFGTLKAKASDSMDLGDLIKSIELELDSLTKQHDAVKGEKAGLAAKIKGLQDQMAALNDMAMSRDAALAEAADLKAKMADMQKQMDEFKPAPAQDSIPLASIPALLEERISLKSEAQRRGVDMAPLAGLSNDSIRTTLVLKMAADSGVKIPEQVSPEWISAFYSAYTALEDRGAVQKTYGGGVADSAPSVLQISPAPIGASTPVSVSTPSAEPDIAPAPIA